MLRFLFALFLVLETATVASAASLDEYEIEFSELRDCMFTIEAGVIINGLKMEFEIDRVYYSKSNQDLYHENIVKLTLDFPHRMKEFDTREAQYHVEKWMEDRSVLSELISMSLNELDVKIRECNKKYL